MKENLSQLNSLMAVIANLSIDDILLTVKYYLDIPATVSER